MNAQNYQIQVSDDGKTWRWIYSTTNGLGGTENLTGLYGTGRYIRIYETGLNERTHYFLEEFKVYGSAMGPQGPEGDVGPSGPAGVTGLIGPQGDHRRDRTKRTPGAHWRHWTTRNSGGHWTKRTKWTTRNSGARWLDPRVAQRDMRFAQKVPFASMLVSRSCEKIPSLWLTNHAYCW